jgi:hypothetical protein
VLGDGLHNAIGLAAQREWIFRTRRLQPQSKHASDIVGLIADGKHGATQCFGH